MLDKAPIQIPLIGVRMQQKCYFTADLPEIIPNFIEDGTRFYIAFLRFFHKMLQAFLSPIHRTCLNPELIPVFFKKSCKQFRLFLICQSEGCRLTQILSGVRQAGILIADAAYILGAKASLWITPQVYQEIVHLQRKRRKGSSRREPSGSQICPKGMSENTVFNVDTLTGHLHRCSEGGHVAVVGNSHTSIGLAQSL